MLIGFVEDLVLAMSGQQRFKLVGVCCGHFYGTNCNEVLPIIKAEFIMLAREDYIKSNLELWAKLVLLSTI